MSKVDAVVYGRFEVQRLEAWRRFMDTMYGLELEPSARPGPASSKPSSTTTVRR